LELQFGDPTKLVLDLLLDGFKGFLYSRRAVW
jgi:hypothetical protein